MSNDSDVVVTDDEMKKIKRMLRENRSDDAEHLLEILIGLKEERVIPMPIYTHIKEIGKF